MGEFYRFRSPGILAWFTAQKQSARTFKSAVQVSAFTGRNSMKILVLRVYCWAKNLLKAQNHFIGVWQGDRLRLVLQRKLLGVMATIMVLTGYPEVNAP